MKKIVILTGAGISAESGIKTFRGSDGLWEGHNVVDVASPDGWRRDRELVLDFYNQRRAQLHEVVPNEAHKALSELEGKYQVNIVTQNIDDLHERGGSTNILHIHGELFKSRSTLDESLVYDCKGDIKVGDKCERGSQLRPHIVWFGEQVPLLEDAVRLATQADIFIIIGTSMVVYPAASLINYVPPFAEKFFVDPFPNMEALNLIKNMTVYEENATTGVRKLVDELLKR